MNHLKTQGQGIWSIESSSQVPEIGADMERFEIDDPKRVVDLQKYKQVRPY